MTKLSKTKILQKRKVKNSARRLARDRAEAQIAQLETRNASLEEQMAVLEEQIALLNGGRQTADGGKQTADGGKKNSAVPTARAGIPLPPPNIESVRQIDSRTLQVSWAAVEDAVGYVIRVSSDSTFATEVRTVEVAAPVTTATLGGLRAETTYFIKAKAVAGAGGTDSDFSGATSATTGSAADDDDATNLQHWLDDLRLMNKQWFASFPLFGKVGLSGVQRSRLLGSGVRRYGFIDKVSDVAEEFPQFWPGSMQGTDDRQGSLKTGLREIEVLRNMLTYLRYVQRVVQDLLLMVGDDTFRTANMYYGGVRAAAKSKLAEAVAVYDLLRLFWKNSRGKSEPTQAEAERDFRSVLRGKKEGQVSVTYESPTQIGGELDLIDTAHWCKHKRRKKSGE